MPRRLDERTRELLKARMALIDERMRALGIPDDAELARRIGVDQSNVTRWRGLDQGMRNEVLYKLAEALKVEYLRLFDPAGFAAAVRGGSAEFVRHGPRRPVLEFGTCGVPSPTDGVLRAGAWEGETLPLPEGEHENVIGGNGYAVRVKGQSMTRWRLREGDIVWVNPDLGRAAGYNRPVLARLLDTTGADLGMVVKVLKIADDGSEYLQSDGDEGDNEVRYRHFEFFAVCVRRQPRIEPLVRDVPNEQASSAASGVHFLGNQNGGRRAG